MEDHWLQLVFASIIYTIGGPTAVDGLEKFQNEKDFYSKTTSCRYTTPVQSLIVSFVMISKAQRLSETFYVHVHEA